MIVWITQNGSKEQHLARMIANRLADSGLSVLIFHIDVPEEYTTNVERLHKMYHHQNLYAVVSSYVPLTVDALTQSENRFISIHCQLHGEPPREDVHLNLCMTKDTVYQCVGQAILFIQKRIGCFTS